MKKGGHVIDMSDFPLTSCGGLFSAGFVLVSPFNMWAGHCWFLFFGWLSHGAVAYLEGSMAKNSR
jgi:hypothetical protein